MCTSLLAVGVFKAPEQIDIFVDLKQISQLYSTVVSGVYFFLILYCFLSTRTVCTLKFCVIKHKVCFPWVVN